VGDVLAGLTVVELGGFYAVPAATAYLVDLGATVIKVEDPDGGDPMRHGHRWAGGDVPHEGDHTLMYDEINRGKEMVAIDLGTPRGQEVLVDLLATADALVTNMRRPALERFGVWFDQLPDDELVYAHLSGYGPRGDERDDRAFDMVAQARSGLMSILARDGEPFTFHLAVDQLAAVSTAWATTTALLARRAGRLDERFVQCSLLGSATDFLRVPLLLSRSTGIDASFPDRTVVPVPTLNPYRCADGEWITLSVGIAGDAYWSALCTALGLGAEVEAAYIGAAERQSRSRELIALLDARFATASSEVWLARLREVGFPSARVNRMGDVADDPQVRANCVTDCDYPDFGTLPRSRFPISGADDAVGAPARIASKGVGADTRRVLAERLGLSTSQLDDLDEAGAIAAAGSVPTPS
jgi:crotonobetainyl-CoA:carnitine CoA-transferase CaiB-like acyl-CoA transferase